MHPSDSALVTSFERYQRETESQARWEAIGSLLYVVGLGLLLWAVLA